MLKTKMYVRCPADIESSLEPRVFVCGQIMGIDDFKRTVTVKIHDPYGYLQFFVDLPRGTQEFPQTSIERCSLFVGSNVVIKGEKYKILTSQKASDGYFYYYVQNLNNKNVIKVSEVSIQAPFNKGQVDPCTQLINYEFQNPVWYIGRAVVSKSMNVLENSIYGFKELAGSKIFLLPHQVNTIMRCLQDFPCRYMLADEVGMGKTIEAISIYKIFMMNQSDTNALILVPRALKEQWTSELLLKFNIPIGNGLNGNTLSIKAIEDIGLEELISEWDFVIVDEVHKYIFDKKQYDTIHKISKHSRNILLLSATPVQQKQEIYLDLLRILLPSKYDTFSVEKFNVLISKQKSIIERATLVLESLSELEEEIGAVIEAEEDIHESEDCRELYEEIYEDLEDICDKLEDEKLTELLDQIDFDSEDLGVYGIKVICSYICSNYQIESNIIRNRRQILEHDDEEEHLLASRELVELVYTMESEKRPYEQLTYEKLSKWIMEGLASKTLDLEQDIKPLLLRFFSSPWAFVKQINSMDIDDEIIENAEKWIEDEKYNLKHIEDILNDPDEYKDALSTRLVTVLNVLFDELYDRKVVLFTNYVETFNAYRNALRNVFPLEEISFFSNNMQEDDLELNAYRFQTEKECRIMLCDYTGGEGRNFQCADYVVHIDLPWDASAIEQRIGRLDRLERDMSRPVVYSVVVRTSDTFEEALFKFFKDGLQIFNQSLSGMEIIMKDINDKIHSAIRDDFKYGLFEKIPEILDVTNKMRLEVRKEQKFDAAAVSFKPMYEELRKLIDFYSRNENELFATTMSSWATLAGFRGESRKNGEISYSANSFSPKSAINSQLIPPQWADYLNSEQNQFLTKVQTAYDKSIARKTQNREIRGTFSRKLAIVNDYLHFFAPGDAVFDCIIDNALNSCKGCSSAIALKSNIDWTGLIFVWSVGPDDSYMLDNNVSLYAMSPYRNYLLSEQILVPVSIENVGNFDDEEILREYKNMLSRGFNAKSKYVHLRKRGREARFLKDEIKGRNIDWFKENFGGEDWADFVISSRKEAFDKAVEVFKRRSNIRAAREEMDRVLSARVANSEYYGMDDLALENMKDTQKVVLNAMKRPKFHLESAVFIKMIKDQEDEYTTD